MDKPNDVELSAELETVFDCCGDIRMVYPEVLHQQMLDGVNGATAFQENGVAMRKFWLTSTNMAQSGIDATYTWNPNLQAAHPTQVGELRLSSGPLAVMPNGTPCSVLNSPQNPNIPDPDDD